MKLPAGLMLLAGGNVFIGALTIFSFLARQPAPVTGLLIGVFSVVVGLGLWRKNENFRLLGLILGWFNLAFGGLALAIFTFNTVSHKQGHLSGPQLIILAITISFAAFTVYYLRKPDIKEMFRKKQV